MSVNTSAGSRSIISHRIRVVITKDNLSANMAVSAPEPNQPDLSLEDIKNAIERAGVVYGIDWEAVEKVIQEHLYDTPVKIASGTPPVKGQDAIIEYTFETNQHHAPKEDADGRIDYRATNFIQSVEEGTVLARKILPTEGTPGTGVDGKEIPAPGGRDVSFKYGKNVKLSEDNLELISTATGAIVFSRGNISVNDITTISGDIDMSVGNIDCIGSIRITGDIQTGFRLNIGGNLEVKGNVQDSSIDCKGNILIKGGCFGEGNGIIHAEGDVVIKYAEGQRITAGNDVIVGGELLNCQVTAKEHVLVKGRRGKIIGGNINAGKKIHCYDAGSDAGTVTKLTAAYDSKLWERLEDTISEIDRIKTDSRRVKVSLIRLYRLQQDNNLNPAQVETIKKLEEFQKGAPEALAKLKETKTELETRIEAIKDAEIIVEGTLYPGVIVQFGNVYREITEAVSCCKLSLDSNRVSISEYRKQ